MGKVVEAAFEEVIDLVANKCQACGVPLCHTAHPGQQVGTVDASGAGLPKIGFYHWECAPTILRATVRANECSELREMLDG